MRVTLSIMYPVLKGCSSSRYIVVVVVVVVVVILNRWMMGGRGRGEARGPEEEGDLCVCVFCVCFGVCVFLFFLEEGLLYD